jgi:hypothetical protein
MGNPSTYQILINSIDCTSYMYNGTFSKDNKQPVKYGAFRFIKTVNNVLIFDNVLIGKSFVVKRGEGTASRTLFQGEVVNVRTTGSVFDLEVADKLFKAVIKIYDYTYDINTDVSSGVGSEIVKDLLDQIGLNYSSTSIPSTGTDALFKLKNYKTKKSVLDSLKDLATIYNKKLYYRDGDDLVYFTADTFESSGVVLTVGDNVGNRIQWLTAGENLINNVTFIGGEQLDWTTETLTSAALQTTFTLTAKPVDTQITVNSVKLDRGVDSSNPKDFYVVAHNKQLVLTVAPFPNSVVANYSYNIPAKVQSTNYDSVDTYNQRDGEIINTNITNSDDAELRASNFLDQNDDVLISAPLKVLRNNTLELGQIVEVVDSQNGKDEFLLVTSIKYYFPFKPDEIIVGLLPVKDNDVTINMINKINDLEKQLSTDSDVSVSLITTSKDESVLGYCKVESAISDADALYWGASAWGSKVWSDGLSEAYVVDSLIPLNNYIWEDFYSTEFKDASTTATWTTTGSCSFTIGQIAVGGYYYFSDARILSATLTADNTTNLTFSLSTDGITYESTTSESLLTFASPGYKLYWKATASGNASLSNVKISYGVE